jgi:hypothetical protein
VRHGRRPRCRNLTTSPENFQPSTAVDAGDEAGGVYVLRALVAASQEFRSAWPVAAAGVGFTIRPSADRSVESDRLLAIDLPVANAMNENGMNVQRVAAAFKINRQPALSHTRRAACPGDPRGSP